jgi:adenylate cyclase
MSNDAENEYFCDGLAEEILNALAKIENLKIAARTSTFFFKGKNTNVSEIGNVLNVKTVLEGSVRKASNRLRITVQLINASDGYHLWSERYDREMKDIFEVQDEITLAVINELKIKLLGEEKAAVLKRYTDNAEAYELYLKGRYFYNKYTPADFQQAIKYFERAVEIEPEYAPAYSGIGFCYGALFYFGLIAAHEIVPKWRALINKALEIDPALADSYLSQASISFYYDWDFAKAEREYRRALELSPDNPDAHWRYGNLLANCGRFQEAVAEGEKAVELDPLSLLAHFFLARFYGFARRFDESFEQVLKIIEIEPNFGGAYVQFGALYMLQEKYGEALKVYQKALALSGFNAAVISLLGACYGVLGEKDKAYEMLDRLSELKKKIYVSPFCMARIYAGLGKKEKAFEWLEKSFVERNGELIALKSEKLAYLSGNSVIEDPRYQDLIQRVGLPQ